MTDSTWSFSAGGAASFPLPSLGTNPEEVLHLGDPTLYYMCVFFSQILQQNLLPRFSDEMAAARMTTANLPNWVDGYACAQAIFHPLYPDNLTTTNYKFPLLAIHPIGEKHFNFTLTNLAVRRDFLVSWVLPPMNAKQLNKLETFMTIASKAFLAFGYQGYDPKVNPFGPSFWQQAGVAFGYIEGVQFKPYLGSVQIQGTDKYKAEYFPSLQMRIGFVERNQMPVPQNYESFSGISLLREDLVDGYNPANPITNFIDGYVYPNITLTSCSPNTGSIQGNTLLVVQGTGFLMQKIARITVNGAQVKSFNVKSPTVILAVTNPGITVGTGDVVAYDQQGNAYTLHNGFTYTSP